MKNKILVADDNPAILDALQIILEDAGYKVKTTIDGVEALEMQRDFPDLILLDIWMSGIDGRDICKQLKKNKATRDIPIIMVSATKNIEQIAKASGADDYVSKPFQLDHLLEVVAKHINKTEELAVA